MSTLFEDGGPAFPVGDMQTAHRVGMAATNGTGRPESEYIAAAARATAGMTLRDYFAAKTMQGIVSSIDSEANYHRLHGHAHAQGLKVSEWIARDAYKQADAMLAAREVRE
jgi:hypothetical protein